LPNFLKFALKCHAFFSDKHLVTKNKSIYATRHDKIERIAWYFSYGFASPIQRSVYY